MIDQLDERHVLIFSGACVRHTPWCPWCASYRALDRFLVWLLGPRRPASLCRPALRRSTGAYRGPPMRLDNAADVGCRAPKPDIGRTAMEPLPPPQLKACCPG
jgi:hypothetical protein